MERTFCRLLAAGLLSGSLFGCTSGNDSDYQGLLGQEPPVVTAAALQLNGPTTVAPGVSTGGYVATFTAGSRGVTNPGVRIELKAAGNSNDPGNLSTVSPCGAGGVEQPAEGGGRTDAQGRVCFNYTAARDVKVPTTVTLFATVPDQKDAAGNVLTKTLTVMVQPATFRFEALDSNTIGLEAGTATPLHFQWTQIDASGSRTTGVAGRLQLNCDGRCQFTLDGTSAGSPLLIDTTVARGDFARAVGVYGTTSGPVNVTALDQSNGRTATLNLQAVATPTGIAVSASPQQIPPSGAQESRSTITATVSGSSGTIQGAAVIYTLTPVQQGSTERLTMTAATSGNSGQAMTQYVAGTPTGTATVEACAEDTDVCGTATIRVVAQ